MAHRPFALVWLFVGFCGCQPEVSHLSWNSLDQEEIDRALDEPTGTLPLREEPEILREVEARLPALLDASRFLSTVMQVAIDVGSSDANARMDELPEVTEGPKSADQTWGTSLYLRIACPGDFESPVTDFSRGEVRLDSPSLTTLDLRELRSGGEFLLSFGECRFGKTQLDAQIPGRYLLNAERLGYFASPDPDDTPVAAVGLDLGVALRELEGVDPLGIVAVACGGKGACQEDYRFAAEFHSSATGSYVVRGRLLRDYWSKPTDVGLEISGATFASACTYSPSGALACDSREP
ncbi:MAG TPA: hypothetical protein VLC09_21305 [Polyangiaceae bacterium]|nr:hypothetical protein [Polyangiaceae bacterium]